MFHPRSNFKPPLKRPLTDQHSSENTSSCSKSVKRHSVVESENSSVKSSAPPPQESIENSKSDIERLREKNNQLDKEILELRQQGFDESQLKIFIEKLNKYNAIKDLGQSLLGQLALRRGVTTKSLYPKFDLELDD